jgi:hypothetical protein
MNQNQHQPNSSSNLIWRPPYPSENLKTPRQQQPQQPQQLPTYSTTNPYAEPEHPQPQQPQQPQHQEQEQPFQIQQSIAHHNDLQHSKRENNSNKIYERGLTPQVGMNPFLKDSNYLQDLETQNEFLKPINSNI